MEVFLHHDVAAASELRVLVADECGIDDGSARRVLRAVHESEEIAGVEIAKAVHLVRWRHGGTERALICVANSKHRSIRSARMWKSRSPGVETAWRGRRESRGICVAPPAAAGQRAGPTLPIQMPMTHERSPSRSRNPTARTSAARRHRASGPRRGYRRRG